MQGDEEMDALDACVFSGELLLINREKFKRMLARWQRAVEEHERLMPEELL